ncbi:response regulator [Sphingosinicella terrae]|uniref:response regulator n=1 Tax=Sphingosinicella terrae TaxID=2172047 RepID=UPI000E0D2227|nr:response regulator [Sphingosinicella terrae]
MDDTTSPSSPGDEGAPVRHVLLVEDEELVAMALGDELERLGWSVVGPATTLEEAQRLVSSGVQLDAAILDVNLQGRWAHGLAEELTRRGVPFVACTGYEMVDPDGRFAGVPVITKPITADRLSATLTDLMERAEPHNPITPSAG